MIPISGRIVVSKGPWDETRNDNDVLLFEKQDTRTVNHSFTFGNLKKQGNPTLEIVYVYVGECIDYHDNFEWPPTKADIIGIKLKYL